MHQRLISSTKICGRKQDTTRTGPRLTVRLKILHAHLELLNLISVVLFVLRCALKWWASWLLPAPPIHNKGQPDEERGCQSPISVGLITTDPSSVTALN